MTGTYRILVFVSLVLHLSWYTLKETGPHSLILPSCVLNGMSVVSDMKRARKESECGD